MLSSPNLDKGAGLLAAATIASLTAEPDAQQALAAERAESAALAASEAKLVGANEQLRARSSPSWPGLRAELEQMKLGMSERDARDHISSYFESQAVPLSSPLAVPRTVVMTMNT